MAGVSRLQYTPDIKIIRLMCTGRLDPVIIADAFIKGLDGLLVVGCHFGDCHYVNGNYHAKARIDMVRKLFKHIGVNEERLDFKQCSSGEAALFVDIVTAFDEKIKQIGPLGEGGDKVKKPEIFEKLKIAKRVLSGEKMRWVMGKRMPFLESGNMYGEVFTEHEFSRAIDMIIVEETDVQAILSRLEKSPASVTELAQELDIPPERVLRYILALKRKGFVQIKEIVDHVPKYQIIEGV